jgi:hypothetical protein
VKSWANSVEKFLVIIEDMSLFIQVFGDMLPQRSNLL